MPGPVSYPGVYVEEVPGGAHPIAGVPTSIALFVGWAGKGPADRAARIASFADFERLYGGFDPDSYLGYGVSQFFANGGSEAYVVRIEGTGAKVATAAIPGLSKFRIEASSSGAWSNGLRVRKTQAGGKLFRLDILHIAVPHQADVVLESFDKLSDDRANRRYAPKLINGTSAYINLIKAQPAAAGASAPPGPGKIGTFRGGVSGTTPAGDEPGFVASVLNLFESGKIADTIDIFNLICVPGLTRRAALESLQRFASQRRAFLIADCARDSTLADVAAGMPNGLGADHSAYYFPWVMAPDPKQALVVRPFPPSGFLAGIYARTDSRRGVWKAPAGLDAVLAGASGPAVGMTDGENGQLNPQAVNAIRAFPAGGTVAWGARTCSGDEGSASDYKYIPVRRLALHIEESIFRGLKWVVFEPNGEALWARIRLSAGAFMNSLFRQGAFVGSTPGHAYFVKCDSGTTSRNRIDLGLVTIVIGFAPLKPAEFVVLTIEQMAGQLEV
jgi:phage tail sheath protein FI